jgi:ribonuclease HI
MLARAPCLPRPPPRLQRQIPAAVVDHASRQPLCCSEYCQCRPAEGQALLLPPPQLAFTDASLRRCRGHFYAGLGVWFGPEDGRNVAASVLKPQLLTCDINRFELAAIYLAMLRADTASPLVNHTDSMSALHMLAKPHRAKDKYAAILHAVQHLISLRAARGSSTSVCKVKAHSGCHGNDQADRLAKQAAGGAPIPPLTFVSLPVSAGAHHLACPAPYGSGA